MTVTLLLSDPSHPAFPFLKKWCDENSYRLCHSSDSLNDGDYLFLISCTEILYKSLIKKFKRVLVLHESDVPLGRGWSPLAWQIIEGYNEIPVTLMECAHPVDSGNILIKRYPRFKGHELYDEIHARITQCKIEMIEAFLKNPDIPSTPQSGMPTFYRKRTPSDSRIDENTSISDNFNLLRIADPRFPAFFEINGHRYEITIKKHE